MVAHARIGSGSLKKDMVAFCLVGFLLFGLLFCLDDCGASERIKGTQGGIFEHGVSSVYVWYLGHGSKEGLC